MNTHAQIWVRLMHLAQEYWRKQTLFEIASGVGTSLIIDEATQSRLFGMHTRVLVDVDMSSHLFDSVIVEREGYAFSVEVQCEKRPSFCSHCKFLGHPIQQCRKLAASNVKHHQDTMSNRQKHAQIEKNNAKIVTNATTSQMVTQEATQHLIARNNTQAKTHTAQTMITGSKEHTLAFLGAQEALEDQSQVV